MSDKPEILVVCTHNAGRSVAARVLLDHYGGDRITVRSAGSALGDEINPVVAQVLTERGLDVSKEFPKPLTDEAARAADILITMGCGDACAVHPGKRYLDWDLTDPAGKNIDEVRPIVDEIERRALGLLEALGVRTVATDHPAAPERRDLPGQAATRRAQIALELVEVGSRRRSWWWEAADARRNRAAP